MSLEPVVVSRVRTFVAAVEPRFDEIVRVFFERMTQACPGAVRLAPPASRRERFDFATSVAKVVKGLESFGPGSPMAVRMSRQFGRAGLSNTDLYVASACLVSALRDAAGPLWTGELEADCSTVVSEVFGCVTIQDQARRPMRVAA